MKGEWHTLPLSECGKWMSGGTPSKEHPEYWNGDIPWISAKAMHSIFIEDSEDKITIEGARNGSRLVPLDTILILVRGSMLYKRIPVCITKREVAFNQDVKAIIVNNKILPKYLLYWLLANEPQLLNIVEPTGIGAGKLTTDVLSKIEVKIPPLAEQRKIAEILGSWDAALALLDRRIAAAEQRKRGLMQRLLTGRVRFPEFEGEAWREVRILDMGKVITGNTPSKSHDEFYSGKFPWASPADMNGPEILYTKNTLTQSGKKIARIVPKGSVLITCIGSIGKNAMAGTNLAFNQQINAIVTNGKFDNTFVYYLIDHQPHKLQKYSGTTSVPIVNKSTFERIKYLVPPSIDEQRHIAAVLDACDREIALLRRKREALAKQKRGLMQRLLTGEVRPPLSPPFGSPPGGESYEETAG